MPTGKVLPGAWDSSVDGVAQLSVAVGGVHVATAEQRPGAAGRLMFEGQGVRTGGVVSATVIVWTCDVTFPQSSVAVHVRWIVKLLAQAPGRIVSEWLTDTLGSQRSVAVAEPVPAGVVSWSHSREVFAGKDA